MIEVREDKINLVFDAPSHTYINGDTGEIFTSVTTLIGKYKDEFDTRFWSMHTGLKDAGIPVKPNVDKQTIVVNGVNTALNTLYENKIFERLARNTQNKWKDKTRRANERGNKIHDYLEDSINFSRGDRKAKDNELIHPLKLKAEEYELVIFETKHDLDQTDLWDTYPIIYKQLLVFIEQGCTIIAEKKIYTAKYMIAGMIDVLVVKGNKFCIVDWKTNKDEMMFSSGYFRKEQINGRWVRGNTWIERDDRMKAPIEHLQRCKGIIYSLQLSLYAYIMELWGYKLVEKGLMIFHIRPRLKPKLIRIRYYRNEVIALLNHFRKSNRIKNVNDEEFDMGFGIG